MRSSLLVVVSLLACMMLFIIGARPSHAATLEGEYTINGVDPSLTNVTTPLPADLPSTQFQLYKVGSFVSGEPYVKLDPPYDGMNISLPLDADKDNVVAWTKEWLQCASTLASNISEGTTPDKAAASGNDGQFQIADLANGLYLLTGDSQKINNYPKTGETSYLWPQPMLVSILNSNAKVVVKPMIASATRLKVRKDWQGIPDNLKDLVQPKSIEIEVYYNNQRRYPNGAGKAIILSDDNNWFFEWEAAVGEGDPSKWTVREVVDQAAKPEFDKNFSVTVGTNFVKDKDDIQVLTITNKYDRYELEIQKTFDAYVDNGEGNSTSITFELSGYADEACSDRVYHKYVGLQLDKSKGGEQKLNVKDIPRGLKHLMVKEVYSGNFKPDKAEKEAQLITSQNDSKGIYSVSFDNSLNNTTHGSGLINKFNITNKAYKFDKSLGAGK